MKRLLITLSAFCFLMADPDPVGNWKLSGLKVDYLHITRAESVVALQDVYGFGISVPVQTIPSGVLFNRITSGPYTLASLEGVGVNLNVNIYPDGTGAIAEGSFYPDIDLTPGTCETQLQIFPVTDTFNWEMAGLWPWSETSTYDAFATTNILGIPGLNDHYGAQAVGFGINQSSTFDAFPSSSLGERIPEGLPYVALADGTVLGYSCETGIIGGACADAGIDAQADPDGCLAALVGAGQIVGDGSGPLEQTIGQCMGADLATADAYFGGLGYLHGSGASGYFATEGLDGASLGNSQMGQTLDVDFLLEWNGIDGPNTGSGFGEDDDIDEDGDGSDFDRIFGLPYISATHIDGTNPLCDITGGALTGAGSGLGDYPVAGDIVDALGGEAAVGALVTGSCIDGTTALCEAAGGATEVVWAGCMDAVVPTVEGLCDAAGSPQAAVAGLCFETSQDPALLATCEYAGVDATVVGACMQLGFAAEDCAAAGGIATAGIADACESGVIAGAEGACAQAGGVWNTIYGGCVAQGGDEATCGAAATAGEAAYGDCATWAAATYAGATCEDAGTTDCDVLVSEAFATEMCGFIAYTLTTSETCDEWAWSVADGFAAQSAETGYMTCTQAAEAATGIPMGSGTAYCGAAADALFALQTGLSCTDYGANYVGMCVVEVAFANDMYLMDPSLSQWGLFLTYNAASVQNYQAAGLSIEEIAYQFPELFVNDSTHDFDPSCYSTGETCGGRLVMNFEPLCMPELEARQIVAEFVNLDDLCEPTGDVNGDELVNVVDVVRMVTHVLGGVQLGGVGGCQADLNGDGVINVVDIVIVVNAILIPDPNRSAQTDATEATILLDNNSISIEADGYIGGLDMVVEFSGSHLSLDLGSADVAEYVVNDDNTARIIMASAQSIEDIAFITSGRITSIIEATLVTSSDNTYVPMDNSDIDYSGTPDAFSVGSAYPNPFNPSTNLSLELNTTADISVKVFNIAGQLVDVIAEGTYSPNTYNWTWDAENLASGVYLVRTQVGNNVDSQKIMLLK